jgi:hypothetical protein
MKTSLPKKITLLLFLLTLSISEYAQVTSQVISIQPGYTNQTFYNMNNGVVSSVVNTDWDLGFQLRGFYASIMINSKNNVHLYKANKDASQWASMVTSDTTGVLSNPSYELFNSDTSWNFGAASTTNDTSNQFDLGWGVYDFVTHSVLGDSIYIIKLSNGIYKKFIIESLAGGVYTFKWADLDGSNQATGTINKSNYTNKAFAYYSIVNNIAIDREPVYNSWDLLFCQYLSLTPYIYKVSGVLLNDSVTAVKAYPVDTGNVSYNGLNFHKEMNTIGYDWKSYDFATNSWLIEDSIVYFVKDRGGLTWKVIFTGFGGSANGDFYFYQSPAQATGLIENASINTFGIFPNPTSSNSTLVLSATKSAPATLSIYDAQGRLIQERNLQLSSGMQNINLDVTQLVPGIYQIRIAQGNEIQTTRLIKQ